MVEIKCSKCGKTTTTGFSYGMPCVSCIMQAESIRTSAPAKVVSPSSPSYEVSSVSSYLSYIDEIYTWDGTSIKPFLAAEAEAEVEAEKTEYETLHEDLRNLRDQSKLSALKQLHETLSAEHDRWVEKYAGEMGGTNTSSYLAGVVGGIGEAMRKIAQMIEVIENDA